MVIGAIVGALCLFSPTTTDLAAHLSEVNLTSALIIGSALALVLSLSIIPAQRAAEAFSPAILKIYARDRALLLVFLLLSGASLLSVLFGTGWTLGLSTGQTLFIQFLVLGISFDALRAFYLRTLALLNPQTAVTLVLNECDLAIAAVRRTVDRLARILRTESNPPEMQPVVRAQLFAASQIVSTLRGWISQLDEFAHKALARKDTDAVNTIMTAMRTIGFRYVEARRTSLVLVPDFDNLILGGQSDLSKVLDPIHENLLAMCKQAAKGDNELVVSHCIRTLGAMTVYALTVTYNHNDLYRSAPLAYSPCFYLGRCVAIALGAHMLDAVLAAIRTLREILQKITRDVERSAVETQAIETLFHIAAASYVIQDVTICFTAVQASLYAALHDTRFEHSLGVMHVATQLFDALKRRSREILRTEYDYSDEGLARQRLIIRLAALLHDLGHGPFSHAAEEVLPVNPKDGKQYSHEDYSAAALKHGIEGVIDNHTQAKNMGIHAADILSIFATPAPTARELVWKDLVSGQMDADRMDYLLRDSYHSGVQYGHYDLGRVVHTLRLCPDDETGGHYIGVEEDGIHAVEGLLIARFMMFTQLYFHKTRTIYDYHLTETLKDLLKQSNGTFPPPTSIADYLQWDDWRVLGAISAGNGGPHGKILSNRDHYRLVFTTAETMTDDEADLAKDLEGALAKLGCVTRDAEKSWYKSGPDEIKVWRTSGGPARSVPLATLSHVVRGLIKVNQRRLYVPLKNRNEARKIINENLEKAA